MVTVDHHRYVQTLLDLYIQWPDTPNRASPYDRRLAYQLCSQGVSLQTIQNAFLLASARRLFRDPSFPPLNPIRSLNYFLPIIKEILDSPPSTDYFIYLRRKLAAFRSKTTQPSPLI